MYRDFGTRLGAHLFKHKAQHKPTCSYVYIQF